MRSRVYLYACIIATKLVCRTISVILTSNTNVILAGRGVSAATFVTYTLNTNVIDTIWDFSGAVAVANALHTRPIGAERHQITTKSSAAALARTAIAGIGVLTARDTAGRALTAE